MLTKTQLITGALEIVDGVVRRKNGKKLTWSVGNHGYQVCGIGRDSTVLHHQVVMLLCTGTLPEMIDHINGDRTDNRISNLRATNHQENSWNQSTKSSNTAAHKNVYPQRGKWAVRIKVNGYFRSFGTHEKIEDAIIHARTKRLELFGEIRHD